MKAPDFWQDPAAPCGRVLAPFGWIYAGVTAWRLAHAHPWRAPVPVICVGNLTAGGTGKTPVVRDLAERLKRCGFDPHILSRGYRGVERGPLRVDASSHDAHAVGDEPLLLARSAPCWVSADRAAGARAMVAAGAGMILMDDGLQNPNLAQDLKLVVVDGETGFGNRRAIPAGPLRETVAAGLARADAMVVIGVDRHDVSAAWRHGPPLLRGRLIPCNPTWIKDARIVAFAGIGRPEKFRETLIAADADIAAFHAFSDHHFYSEQELTQISAEAGKAKAILVTTEKDWVRLTPAWRDRVRAVPVQILWDDESSVARLIAGIGRNG